MTRLALALFALLAVSSSFADDLPRRFMFGAQLAPAKNGVEVKVVAPGAPAAVAGLQTGDIITALQGTKVASPQEFISTLKALRDPKAEIEYTRGGAPSKVTLALKEVALETSSDFDVIYDSVRAKDSLRRTIITRPRDKSRHPAVLFAGGIGCYSVDGIRPEKDGYAAIIHDLTRAGFVVMRVEKSGMGDSQGVPCPLQDFENELAGYRASLARLRDYDFVDAKRVYILGHSIGGIVAPVLASESNVRGVVAMDTAGHRWTEYEEINSRRQSQMEGLQGDALEKRLTTRRRCAERLLVQRESAESILRDDADCAPFLQYPAHYRYVQQLAALDFVALWKKVNAPVLLIYGESDFVTDVEEHRVIERAVNGVKKGRATLIVEPRLDHFLRDVGSQQESMRIAGEGKIDDQPLQAQVRRDLIKWLKSH